MTTNGVYFHTFSIMVEAIAMLAVESLDRLPDQPHALQRVVHHADLRMKIQRQMSAITTVGTI